MCTLTGRKYFLLEKNRANKGENIGSKEMKERHFKMKSASRKESVTTAYLDLFYGYSMKSSLVGKNPIFYEHLILFFQTKKVLQTFSKESIPHLIADIGTSLDIAFRYSLRLTIMYVY